MLKDRQELLDLFDQEMRVRIEFPGMRKELTPEVVRFLRQAPGMSFILYSSLNGGDVDAAIQAQIDYFSSLDQPFEWTVYEHDFPRDLVQKLCDHGFETQDPDTVMVLDLREAPASLVEPVGPEIQALTRRDQLRDVIQIEAQVWGGTFDWIMERMGQHLEQPGYLSVYIGYNNSQPASVGWIYFHPNSDFASLKGGSTRPEFRARGLYTGILAARAQEAIQRGYRFLILEANSNSRPISARHGFRTLTRMWSCIWGSTLDP